MADKMNKRFISWAAPLLLGFAGGTACYVGTLGDGPNNDSMNVESPVTEAGVAEPPTPDPGAETMPPSEWVASLRAVMDDVVPDLEDPVKDEFLALLQCDLEERIALNPAMDAQPLSRLTPSIRAWLRMYRGKLYTPTNGATVEGYLGSLRWLIADATLTGAKGEKAFSPEQDALFAQTTKALVRATPYNPAPETEEARRFFGRLADEVEVFLTREIARLRADSLFPSWRTKDLNEVYAAWPSHFSIWPWTIAADRIQYENIPRLVRGITQMIIYNSVNTGLILRMKAQMEEWLGGALFTVDEYQDEDSVIWPVDIGIGSDNIGNRGREFHDITTQRTMKEKYGIELR